MATPRNPIPARVAIAAACLLSLVPVPRADTAPADAAQDAPADAPAKKQEILFPEIRVHRVDDAPFSVAARATSGLPVTLELVTGPALLDKTTVRLTGQPGLVALRAVQAGGKGFLPAPSVERTFEVQPMPFAPRFAQQPYPVRTEMGETVVLRVRVEGYPRPEVQWMRDGQTLVGADRPELRLISVSQRDSGTYAAVATNSEGHTSSEPARVEVSKRHQSIMFMLNQSSYQPGQSIQLRASSSSGLPVHFEVLSGIATIMGDTLYPSSGSVTVQAVQQGDANWDSARPVPQTLLQDISVLAR